LRILQHLKKDLTKLAEQLGVGIIDCI